MKKQNIIWGNVTNFQSQAARENTPIPQEAIRRSCGNGALKKWVSKGTSCFFLISFFNCCSDGVHLPAHSLCSVGMVLSPSRGLSGLCCEGLWITKSFQGCWRGWSTFLFLFVEHKACRREIAKYCSSPAGVREVFGLFTRLPPEPTSSFISINKLPLHGFYVRSGVKRGREMKGDFFVEWIIPLPLSSLPSCLFLLPWKGGLTWKNLGIHKRGHSALGLNIHHLRDQFMSGLRCNFSLQFFCPSDLESEKIFIESAPCNSQWFLPFFRGNWEQHKSELMGFRINQLVPVLLIMQMG